MIIYVNNYDVGIEVLPTPTITLLLLLLLVTKCYMISITSYPLVRVVFLTDKYGSIVNAMLMTILQLYTTDTD